MGNSIRADQNVAMTAVVGRLYLLWLPTGQLTVTTTPYDPGAYPDLELVSFTPVFGPTGYAIVSAGRRRYLIGRSGVVDCAMTEGSFLAALLLHGELPHNEPFKAGAR